MAGDSAGPEEIAGACRFDPSKPNAARIYDYLLGGKNNFAADRDAPAREQVQAAYGTGTVLTGRPRAEIAAYFGDFDLVPPGLVPITDWPLDMPGGAPLPMLRPMPSAPMKAGMLAGIGLKRG